MLRSSEHLQGLAYAREGQTRWGTISVSVSLVKWVAIMQMGR
jgi:hypothetical protein